MTLRGKWYYGVPKCHHKSLIGSPCSTCTAFLTSVKPEKWAEMYEFLLGWPKWPKSVGPSGTSGFPVSFT